MTHNLKSLPYCAKLKKSKIYREKTRANLKEMSCKTKIVYKNT